MQFYFPRREVIFSGVGTGSNSCVDRSITYFGIVIIFKLTLSSYALNTIIAFLECVFQCKTLILKASFY